MKNLVLLFLCIGMFAGSCTSKIGTGRVGLQRIKLWSESFSDNGNIPVAHSCKGEERSPSLSWQRGPENTRSYCLIMTDIDVPIPFVTIYHWLLFNIPPTCVTIPEGCSAEEFKQTGIQQGKRSFGKDDYLGPCPPFGSHRYTFQIFALDTIIEQKPQDVTIGYIARIIDKHTLAAGKLVGHFPGTTGK